MEDEKRNGFVVTGGDFIKAIKLIKKAFPRKKKNEIYADVLFKVAENKASISMTGGEVYIKADCFGCFTAEIPFALFKSISKDQYDNDRTYTFLFDDCLISINGVSYRFPDITFNETVIDYAVKKQTTNDKTTDNQSNKNTDVTIDEMISYLGLPLLGIYYYLKQYPRNTLTDRRFMEGQAEIDGILRKVDKLLKPLGLDRYTIEKILDDRNPYKNK